MQVGAWCWLAAQAPTALHQTPALPGTWQAHNSTTTCGKVENKYTSEASKNQPQKAAAGLEVIQSALCSEPPHDASAGASLQFTADLLAGNFSPTPPHLLAMFGCFAALANLLRLAFFLGLDFFLRLSLFFLWLDFFSRLDFFAELDLFWGLAWGVTASAATAAAAAAAGCMSGDDILAVSALRPSDLPLPDLAAVS